MSQCSTIGDLARNASQSRQVNKILSKNTEIVFGEFPLSSTIIRYRVFGQGNYALCFTNDHDFKNISLWWKNITKSNHFRIIVLNCSSEDNNSFSRSIAEFIKVIGLEQFEIVDIKDICPNLVSKI